MALFRKKSFIMDWWVAEAENKFEFVDITDKRNLTSNCIVHGRKYSRLPQYTSSVHCVEKVTGKGVYTSSGRFYPFKTAHPLFLIFLSEIHTPTDALIANKWECIDRDNNVYIADIKNTSGKNKYEVIFDFEQVIDDEFFFIGTSDLLDDAVILNPFDAREFSDHRAMEGAYPVELYHSASTFSSMRRNAIKNLKKVLKKQRKNKKSMGS